MGINNMIFSTFCKNTYTLFFVRMDTITRRRLHSCHSVSDLTQRKLLSNNNGPRIAYQIFLPTLCNFSVLFDYFFFTLLFPEKYFSQANQRSLSALRLPPLFNFPSSYLKCTFLVHFFCWKNTKSSIIFFCYSLRTLTI